MTIPMKTLIGAALVSIAIYYSGYLAWQAVFS